MNDDFKILLEEIRENRKAIAKLEIEMNTVKIKFSTITAIVSTVFGLLGAYIKGKLGN